MTKKKVPPELTELPPEVRCPICGLMNAWMRYCPHVRWTFDQGGPLDFARFAIETSPYIRGRGYEPSVIPDMWFNAQGEWIVEQVQLHFDAIDGYVFGHIGDLDVLTMDIWQLFRPDPARRAQLRR
ncbi:MAG TPA: hypothetical protein VEZ14_13915 [Dehalococcoidia bacterium]|nr:hypothetical protein [Dehalococcoidia bacterium]